MAIPSIFPPRKRRPSPEAFISPKFTDQSLVQSLLLLSREISSLNPLDFVLKRCSSSMISKSKILSFFFEDILRKPLASLPRSAVLCFEEIYIVLQNIRTLLEDCANGSKILLLIQNEAISNSFHELMVELSTLLDILPIREFDLSEDVTEMVLLIRKQCWEKKSFIDPTDQNLRLQVSKLLEQIMNEIVPDHFKLKLIFEKLGLSTSRNFKIELESLEKEARTHPTDEIISLIGLVRYAKCVLFGASTPRYTKSVSCSDTTDVNVNVNENVPVDFHCPISLELMRDPVVVATGQTYDRSSINHWIESGHSSCPKTGQALAHTHLIPNRALKNLIALWCRERNIPFEITEINYRIKGSTVNKAALEATKMTALFLVKKLSASPSTEAANRLVYELRLLTKTDSENRACIAEAGAIASLMSYLTCADPNLQINAVTTILNLSILESNKKRIMETDGVMYGIMEALRSGATWEAKQNAAATIFSMSTVQEYRKNLGKRTRVVKGLLALVKEGPSCAKKDALVAILSLAGERESVGRLIAGGVVDMAIGVAEEFPEEAMGIVSSVAKRGGVAAVVVAVEAVKKIAEILKDGPPRARESAAAAMVSICRRGGQQVVEEVVSVRGLERAIWELLATGTVRAKRKSASLLRIIRRRASGADDQRVTHGSRTVQHS